MLQARHADELIIVGRMDGTLRERLRPRLPSVSSELVRERLADIKSVFFDRFLTLPLRDLLLALAEHSEFLWQIRARAPERLVVLVEQAPEAAKADLVARQRGESDA